MAASEPLLYCLNLSTGGLLSVVIIFWMFPKDLIIVHLPAELSSNLMEKIQAQEMMSGLRIPEMDEFGHFFHSLPTPTLLGIGALTAVLAYWFATRPQGIQPPCNLQHQSEEVPVGQMVR